ncbi:MAG: ComEC/Rec2 family competence protein [Clostridia bacterium]|nr:ComEC/Rec2 family competence protein [Clostridia bacterium]
MMKKLVNFRLMLFIALSFCAGIISVYFSVRGIFFWAVFVAALFLFVNLIFIILFSTSKTRKLSLLFSVLFLIAFCLGGLFFSLRVKNFEDADLGNHYYEITGKVVEVYETAYGKKYVIKNAHVKGNLSGTLTNKIALYVNGDSDYDVGDFISFSDYLEDKPLFYEGRFSANDIADRVKYTANVSAEEVLLVGRSRTVFETINVGIRENLKLGLGEKQFPIAYALLTGNSEQIDPDVIYAYRSAGVAHIFAVSGLHIGFLAMALNFLFDKLKLNRIIKAFIITAILILFSGVCGFSASSLRATVMSAVLLFSAIGGYKYDKYTSVSIAALIVLCVSPVQLLCAGFQLSFIIVIGMFLLTKPIYKLLKFLPTKIAHSLSSVIAAQLVAIPASLAIFGQFSTIAVIANLLLVPVVGALFIALIVAVVLTAIIGLHHALFFLPDLALRLLNAIITAVDYQAFIIGGICMGGFVVFYYVTVVIVSDLINLKTLSKSIVASITALTFVVGTIVYTDYQVNRTRAYVCGSETVCATVISTPKQNVMIISDVDKTFYTNRLNRIAKTVGKDLDTVVVLGGFYCDIQVLASQLRTVFDLESICYYGDRNADVELAVMKSFPTITVDNYLDGKNFSCGDISFNFIINGNAVEIDVSGKSVIVFSAFDKDNAYYSDVDKSYDFAVYLDLVENLSATVKAERSLSYRRNSLLSDAESGGNAIVLLA